MILFCLVMGTFLALVPHVIWLVGLVIAKVCGHGLRYAPFGWAALTLATAFCLSMAYGYHVGRWRLVTREVEFAHKDVPAAFDGFRIVHISDMHLSTFQDRPEKLAEFVDGINKADADVVCFTGDLVSLGVKEADGFEQVLAGIKAKHGVCSVLGNHDFMIYGRLPEDVRKQEVGMVVSLERDVLGWELLRDSSKVIEGPDSSKITIIGVDNKNISDQGFQTINEGDLGKALSGTDGFRVLLTHDPSHWDGEVIGATDIQLTLSGHTHAAQVKLFGWSPAALMFKRVYGRYDVDGQTIYVNPGLGCTAPFRIGARPEITIITLHHA